MQPVNEDDLEWQTYDPGDREFRRKQLTAETDAEQLGCSLYELPPGERAWPYHYHTANEEAIYVLEGEGRLRTEDGDHSLEPGDFATFPADERGGHQVVNDGDEPLRYLAMSTMTEPDVTVYPEMEKIGVFAGSPPGGREERTVHGYFRLEDETDYWETQEDRS